MCEVDFPGLIAGSGDPVLTHFVDRRRVRRAFAEGGAVVVVQEGRDGPAPMLLALGPAEELAPLLRRLVPLVERPGRVIVEAPAAGAVPPQWAMSGPRAWFWMTVTSAPEVPPRADAPVVDVSGAPDEVDALLDVAFPDSHTRPATAGAECWLGVRDPDRDDRLVAVGALSRRGDGTGHLGGIATHPSYAGRGLGTAVTVALARRALTGGPDGPRELASLGVYTDNDAAVGVYKRLGFRTARTFVSGPVASPP